MSRTIPREHPKESPKPLKMAAEPALGVARMTAPYWKAANRDSISGEITRWK